MVAEVPPDVCRVVETLLGDSFPDYAGAQTRLSR